MAACWEPGARDVIHGVADMQVPGDLREPGSATSSPPSPTSSFEVLDVIAAGEKAAVHWHATGTFNGSARFEGLVPNGGRVDVQGCDVLTVRDGKVVHNDAYMNGAEMARQLGALPPAGLRPGKGDDGRAQPEDPARRPPPKTQALRPAEAPGYAGAMAEIDRKRIAALTEAQQEHFRNRTGASARTFERAVKVMPGGVPSSFQENDPWPVYIERGEGSRVWDVDGNEYVDFHNGFGVMCIGHANPTVGAAVKARIDEGTHFAAPTDGSIAVAEELVRRFGLPQWRFNNSGTEATMDAVHLARGATGRDTILKIEGSYHGHHDA